MKNLNLENSDDIIVRFRTDSVVEVFEHEDIELHEPVEEFFSGGSEIDVTLFDDPKEIGGGRYSLSVQFGDGSIAFLVSDAVEIVEVNGDPVN